MHAKTLRPWSTHRLTQTTPSPSSVKTDFSETYSKHLLHNSNSSEAPDTQLSRKEIHGNSSILTTLTAEGTSRRRRPLKPLKAAITLTPTAVEHLRTLLDSPEPKLIRIGVRNRGCSGLTYHLEYVEKPGKFDEEVSQDGVKVLIDSKALFSVIGSKMDWVDDKLSSRFVFTNPNSKGECGCGESFMV